MQKLIREPLFHFLLLGAALFGVSAWLNRSRGDTAEPRVVRITAAEVDWLQQTWSRQWQRSPTDAELRGLVTDYLKESLLAREARELGLEENDTIVRRRLAQKVEFLVQDTVRLAEPTDAELSRFYETNRERYQTPARVSFEQKYFKTEAAARRALEIEGEGEPTLLEREHADADEQAVTSVFGGEFAARVFALTPGPWQGPVRSGYGFHLVRVAERAAAKPRAWDEVRAQVRDDWQREQQAKAHEQFFAALLKKYDVVVDESVKPLLGPLGKQDL